MPSAMPKACLLTQEQPSDQTESTPITLVELILLKPLPTTFSYHIENNTASKISCGDWVQVPFGKQELTGLVIDIKKNQVAPFKTKAILGLNQDISSVPLQQLKLCLWLSKHYQCSLYCALQTVIGTAPKCKDQKKIKKDLVKPSAYKLTQDQDRAINGILDSKYQKSLVFGITGSGKTEVYLACAQHAVEQNTQALILVPEISLTPQLYQQFEARFGNRVLVLHSGLTPAKKRKAKAQVLNHHVDVVIGPRSALFCPFANLKLIILDEEHENSYKQDQHPRYLSHVVAKKLAKLWDAKLVYGSATPSLETFLDVPKQAVFKLNNRINQQKRPIMEIIDTQSTEEQTGFFLSHHSIKALKDCLAKKEKALIFINRRGFAPSLICQRCQTKFLCEGCGLSWTVHQDGSCRCHRCQLKIKRPSVCGNCQKPGLVVQGLGSQKCDLLCKQLFPNAVITRLDKDTAKTAEQTEKLLDTFKQDGDILIGTQMIAKGLHIQKLSLVIVLGTDHLLHFPDFRASERAFQLLVQVAGRAGRDQHQGKIIVETQNPQHPVLEQAKSYDIDSFLTSLAQQRERFNYPPFYQLINILLSSENKLSLEKYQKELKQYLNQVPTYLISNLKIYGPKPCAIEKIRFHWRFHCLIKFKPTCADELKAWLMKLPPPKKNIRLFLDIDPRHIL